MKSRRQINKKTNWRRPIESVNMLWAASIGHQTVNLKDNEFVDFGEKVSELGDDDISKGALFSCFLLGAHADVDFLHDDDSSFFDKNFDNIDFTLFDDEKNEASYSNNKRTNFTVQFPNISLKNQAFAIGSFNGMTGRTPEQSIMPKVEDPMLAHDVEKGQEFGSTFRNLWKFKHTNEFISSDAVNEVVGINPGADEEADSYNDTLQSTNFIEINGTPFEFITHHLNSRTPNKSFTGGSLFKFPLKNTTNYLV